MTIHVTLCDTLIQCMNHYVTWCVILCDTVCDIDTVCGCVFDTVYAPLCDSVFDTVCVTVAYVM